LNSWLKSILVGWLVGCLFVVTQVQGADKIGYFILLKDIIEMEPLLSKKEVFSSDEKREHNHPGVKVMNIIFVQDDTAEYHNYRFNKNLQNKSTSQ